MSVVVGLSSGFASRAAAQVDHLGGQSRANAIQQSITLAVQQGISALPPSSGQEFIFEPRPGEEFGEMTELLGPTVFHSTETIDAGSIALRAAASYFHLSDSLGPTEYLVEMGSSAGIIGLGSRTDTKVGIVNLSASYGLPTKVKLDTKVGFRRIEVMLNLPITIVRARAEESFSTRSSLLHVDVEDSRVSGRFQSPGLSDDPSTRKSEIEALQSSYRSRFAPACDKKTDDCFVFRKESFTDLGFDFNEGTHVGLGRASVGMKGLVYSSSKRNIQVAAMTEIFFPSPSEAEFSGPDSAAILPRLIVSAPIRGPFYLHADAGYDYDFSESTLRRFVWTAGMSLAGRSYSVDCGLSGSKYDSGIRWTPDVVNEPAFKLTNLGNNTLGDTFVDWIGGLKFEMSQNFALSAAVTVPLNGEGLRPDLFATVALEGSFNAPSRLAIH